MTRMERARGPRQKRDDSVARRVRASEERARMASCGESTRSPQPQDRYTGGEHGMNSENGARADRAKNEVIS